MTWVQGSVTRKNVGSAGTRLLAQSPEVFKDKGQRTGQRAKSSLCLLPSALCPLPSALCPLSLTKNRPRFQQSLPPSPDGSIQRDPVEKPPSRRLVECVADRPGSTRDAPPGRRTSSQARSDLAAEPARPTTAPPRHARSGPPGAFDALRPATRPRAARPLLPPDPTDREPQPTAPSAALPAAAHPGASGSATSPRPASPRPPRAPWIAKGRRERPDTVSQNVAKTPDSPPPPRDLPQRPVQPARPSGRSVRRGLAMQRSRRSPSPLVDPHHRRQVTVVSTPSGRLGFKPWAFAWSRSDDYAGSDTLTFAMTGPFLHGPCVPFRFSTNMAWRVRRRSRGSLLMRHVF